MAFVFFCASETTTYQSKWPSSHLFPSTCHDLGDDLVFRVCTGMYMIHIGLLDMVT